MNTKNQSSAEAHGDERAAFEAKFGKHQKWCDPEVVAQLDQPLCETLVGKYVFKDIQKAWEAWQASAARFDTQPKGTAPGFDECVASGQSCSYGPHGPKGEMQCCYCGKEKTPSSAVTHQAPEGWMLVPKVGTRVKADHPITCLNPEETFEVTGIGIDNGRISVRGDNTCWFGLGLISYVPVQGIEK